MLNVRLVWSVTWAFPRRCPPAELEPWAQRRPPAPSSARLSEHGSRYERLWRSAAASGARRAAPCESSAADERTETDAASSRYPETHSYRESRRCHVTLWIFIKACDTCDKHLSKIVMRISYKSAVVNKKKHWDLPSSMTWMQNNYHLTSIITLKWAWSVLSTFSSDVS